MKRHTSQHHRPDHRRPGHHALGHHGLGHHESGRGRPDASDHGGWEIALAFVLAALVPLQLLGAITTAVVLRREAATPSPPPVLAAAQARAELDEQWHAAWRPRRADPPEAPRTSAQSGAEARAGGDAAPGPDRGPDRTGTTQAEATTATPAEATTPAAAATAQPSAAARPAPQASAPATPPPGQSAPRHGDPTPSGDSSGSQPQSASRPQQQQHEPQQPPPPQPQSQPQERQQPPPTSEEIFAREFPEHAAARQREGDPSSSHWAVIVGVNDYAGRTQDTIGSVADAHVMRHLLLSQGWREDHVLTLTDRTATHDRIIRAIEWLIRSTDERSTVVFSFSGHMEHERGNTALWPADNRFIWNNDLGRMMGAVRAGRVWLSLQGCHAEGLRAAGLEGPGRVVTYSSRRHEKSYEDPSAGHSVQGNYLFREALLERRGDRDGDGRISVQEAFAYAAPRANMRTSGRQTPVIADRAGGPFFLPVSG